MQRDLQVFNSEEKRFGRRAETRAARSSIGRPALRESVSEAAGSPAVTVVAQRGVRAAQQTTQFSAPENCLQRSKEPVAAQLVAELAGVLLPAQLASPRGPEATAKVAPGTFSSTNVTPGKRSRRRKKSPAADQDEGLDDPVLEKAHEWRLSTALWHPPGGGAALYFEGTKVS